jgi:chromate reductase
MTLELADIADLPLYSGDLDGPPQPAPVVRFREKIRAADALLFATPEYNHSVSGVLKNAIDWASRPPADPVFNGKPAAMLGASMGMFGTLHSQLHLRQICAALNLIVLNKPEVMIARAQDKFDASGKLIDEPTAKFIRQLLEALADWTRRLRSNL